MHTSLSRLLHCFRHRLLIQLHLTDELPQGIYVSLAEEQHNSSWDMATIRAKLVRIVAIPLVPAKASAHTLRHTFVHNYLAEYPGDVVGLATLLGHTSLDTTRIYSQPTVELLTRRVGQLSQNAYADF